MAGGFDQVGPREREKSFLETNHLNQRQVVKFFCLLG
jgi:hypothetical protein